MHRFVRFTLAATALAATAAPAAAQCGCVVRHRTHHHYRPVAYLAPPVSDVVERPVYVNRPVYVDRPVYVERREFVAPLPAPRPCVYGAGWRGERFEGHERYGRRDGYEHEGRGWERPYQVGFEGRRDRGW